MRHSRHDGDGGGQSTSRTSKANIILNRSSKVSGNLKEFKYSYDGNVAELNIKVAFISVNGKGAMHVDGAYTNFVY